MPRRRGRDSAPGFVVVDKPADCTSFDVIRALRRSTGVGRIGHGGTLDPFATGVLVVGLGPATRLLRFLSEGEKTYLATLHFGRETDSGDLTGEVVREADVLFSRDDLMEACAEFVGTIQQVPPRLSALKVDGKRSYHLARDGQSFEHAARPVDVHAIDVIECALPTVVLRVRSGGGTYVRAIARDLGVALGSAAHLTALRRETVGPFGLEDSVSLDRCRDHWDSPTMMLPALALTRGWNRLRLDDDQVRAVGHGQQPLPGWWDEDGSEWRPGLHALVDAAGELAAVAEIDDAERARLVWVRPLAAQASEEDS